MEYAQVTHDPDTGAAHTTNCDRDAEGAIPVEVLDGFVGRKDDMVVRYARRKNWTGVRTDAFSQALRR